MKDYHEPWEKLPEALRDHTRALTSLKEEIEAADWYAQRVAACQSPELREILAHNQREEVEHACMLIEWLRRNSATWDEHLRQFLFSEAPIIRADGHAPPEANGRAGSAPSLGLGALGGGSE